MSRAASFVTVGACASLLALAGCGDDGASTVDAGTDAPADAPTDAALDAPTEPLRLTSSALAEGTMFQRDNTCNGANTSPPFSWVNTPAATMSLALVLTDVTPGVNLIHWVIYDIPAAATGLPTDIDKTYAPTDVLGAHQAKSYDMQVTGYLGPCPPSMHMYRFTLYALDLPALTATATTSRVALQAMLLDHDLATASINGTYVQQ